ncbi:MAG: iron-sulfur cluster assembly scaffold protein [Desulfobacter sp.]|nr:iron-sulfur cluster assembly scaffold protein [Desulfobacter sp.]WDP86107.1 MAG: iron-sulfur cluster assembly scaffold protein [Desulfobacter sp.]
MDDTDFWNSHSLHFLEMAYKNDHREKILHPDGYGTRTGDCGDRVEFFIMVDQGRLATVSFELDGCVHTVACCNTVVQMSQGLTLEKAWEINADKVASYLETLPEDHYHCAELSVGGFYLALSDYQNHNFKKR